ncbi:MAG: carboxymuconolactone decarboxylase family protein [Chloroflexi bacterium]|nr:carboxymuconolactone decarboxylase family protein [Chloroflexota bacterium]MDA1002221.1 carboxymuconolactone decarboxylase family protein [Chloroflexota bacterium]
MPHVEPLRREDLAEYEAVFAASEERQGYVANSLFLLGHRPPILSAFMRLFGATMGDGEVDRGLKQLVAQVASTASGCRYCQAHTANAAHEAGVPAEKVAALFDFESSAHFDAAERAALRLARDAAIVPNAVTAAHFEALGRHFEQPQIVELMAVVALFGFLNRWNDSLGTELEGVPRDFAAEYLAAGGWEPGKHAE